MADETMNKQSCDFYFDSYAHYTAHEDLLKDKYRMRSFKNAIFENKERIKGKAVLDAGTGTGIFAMWAAQAGARVVYAVEQSSIAEYAEKIVKLNGFSAVIKIIHGKIEEVELPEKVDFIICDFMGSCLLFDSMIPSLIVARDRFLKEDGIILPSESRLIFTGIEDSEYRSEKIGFWDNVYGFKFSAMKKVALVEPLIESCPTRGILAKDCLFKTFDMKTIKKEDLSFNAPFELLPDQDNIMHSFVIWFDVFFNCPHKTIRFTTSPYHDETCYYQTICYLNDPIEVHSNVPIKGSISMKPNKDNERNEDVKIEFDSNGKHYSQYYLLKI